MVAKCKILIECGNEQIQDSELVYRLVNFAHLNKLFNQTQLTQTYLFFRNVVVKHVWSKLKIRTPSKVLKNWSFNHNRQNVKSSGAYTFDMLAAESR